MKKYEREIRELLDNLDAFVPEGSPSEKDKENKDRNREREPEVRKRPVGVMPPQPIPINSRRPKSGGLRHWLTEHNVSTALQLMVGGLLLVAVAFIITDLAGNSWLWLAQIVGAIGGIVFLSPLLIRFFTGSSIGEDSQQYWRGQPIETESFSWDSVKRMFGGGRNNKPPKDPFNGPNKRW